MIKIFLISKFKMLRLYTKSQKSKGYGSSVDAIQVGKYTRRKTPSEFTIIDPVYSNCPIALKNLDLRLYNGFIVEFAKISLNFSNAKFKSVCCVSKFKSTRT